jgi:hypothetical protein
MKGLKCKENRPDPRFLVLDLQTIYILVGLAAAVLAIFGEITGFFKWIINLYRRIQQFPTTNIAIPKKTVILIPIPNGLWWHMGGRGNEPVMQIVGDLNVTNISKYGIYLKAVRLRKPKTDGHVMLRAHQANVYGNYMIPKGAVRDLRFDIFVEPLICEKGKPFKADVAIINQFGNEHWLKGLEFRYT